MTWPEGFDKLLPTCRPSKPAPGSPDRRQPSFIERGSRLVIEVAGSGSYGLLWLGLVAFLLASAVGFTIMWLASGVAACGGGFLVIGGVLVLLQMLRSFKGREIIVLSSEGLSVKRVLGTNRHVGLDDLSGFICKRGNVLLHRDLPIEDDGVPDWTVHTKRPYLFAMTKSATARALPEVTLTQTVRKSIESAKHLSGLRGRLCRWSLGPAEYPEEIPIAIHATESQLVEIQEALAAQLAYIRTTLCTQSSGDQPGQSPDARPAR
jgi:hypothetical protein